MPWVKGQSGNPGGRVGGRPRRVLELVELARESCDLAIKRAVELLSSQDERVAIAAATFLRDTGMGRPSQAEFDVAALADEALIAEVRRRADAARERDASQRVGQPSVGVEAGAIQPH